MELKLNRQKDGTVKIKVVTTPNETQNAKTKALNKFTQEITITGFRPGKAPLGMVEQKIKTTKLFEETLSQLADEAYRQAIKEHQITTLTKPRVNIPALQKQTEPEQEIDMRLESLWPGIIAEGFEFEITTYSIPDIILGDWTKVVQETKAGPQIETAETLKEANRKATKEKIENQKKLDQALKKTPEEQDKELENIILDNLIEKIKFDLPQELIDLEAEQQFLYQIRVVQELGISYPNYLKSQNKKPEEVEKEIKTSAEKTLRIRFILGRIAETNPDKFSNKPTGKEVIEHLKDIAGAKNK